MTETEKNILIKKLLYKSKNRGCKETDLILGKFADRHLEAMTKEEQKDFAKILAQNDADIYDWVTKKSFPPLDLQSEVMDKLLDFEI
jgi:succinate dehydrogenase flavin-adding protein (antitoxin of CptAB toxin-antitoxin module)